MTQDEILAALREVVAANNQYTTWTVSTPHLVALVNLAIDREREACAKVCEAQADDGTEGEWDGCCLFLAGTIRSRGQA
jgi:hypothetical protein